MSSLQGPRVVLEPSGPSKRSGLRELRAAPEVERWWGPADDGWPLHYDNGTSMASPHAAGVAALIVSRWGRRDAVNGGRTLRPRIVERLLARTALDVPCPEPRTYVYPPAPELEIPELQATCEGSPAFNGFYGHGIVNALRAVLRR